VTRCNFSDAHGRTRGVSPASSLSRTRDADSSARRSALSCADEARASKRGTRSAIPVTGGSASGRVAGSVLSGGGDYQLRASSFSLDARYTIRTADGFLVLIRNCGPIGALVLVFETRAAEHVVLAGLSISSGSF
jgi:hypothetical protein